MITAGGPTDTDGAGIGADDTVTALGRARVRAERLPTPLLALPAVLVGAAAAWPGLTRPALWFDEALSIGAVHQPDVALRQSGGTMATYYGLLAAWTSVGEHRIWVRTLSLVLGLAAVVVLTALVRRWLGASWSVVVGVLVVTGPMWGRLVGEARGYTLALLLAVASWSVLDRLVRDPRPCVATAFVAIWVLLPPTHGLAVLLVPAQGLALVAARVERRTWAAAVPGLVTGVGLTGILAVAGGGDVTDWIPPATWVDVVGSSRVDLQACKLEYSIVSPK